MKLLRKLGGVATEFILKSTVQDIVLRKDKLLTFRAEIHDSNCVKKWRIVGEVDFNDLDKAHLSLVCLAEVLWYDTLAC